MSDNTFKYFEFKKCLNQEHNVWASVTVEAAGGGMWNAEIFVMEGDQIAEVGYHQYFPISVFTEESGMAVLAMLEKKYLEDNKFPDLKFDDGVVNGTFRRQNKTAVLFSSGYGAGWSTWADSHVKKELVFDPMIVEYILRNSKNETVNGLSEGDKSYLFNYAKTKYPDVYMGGFDDIGIEWVPVGKKFRIDEYDGNESIEILTEIDWLTS